jgi:hypothetical protein
LIAIERKTWDVPEFGAAYEAGALSWVRALTLLPVLTERSAPAWTARAQAVTVRRLVAEVEWSLDQWDTQPPVGSPPGPPPAGQDLGVGLHDDASRDTDRESGADAAQQRCAWGTGRAGDGGAPPIGTEDVRETASSAACQMRAPAAWSPIDAAGQSAADLAHQMRARDAWSPIDAEIAFAGPATVVAMLEAAIGVYRKSWEPRWRGVERLLEHVAAEWTAQPRHPDPIFARDGWRCAVPACEARGNLHDHHIQFRSHGGDNARANRVSVCAWHHLRGIHSGRVRARGMAPAGIYWELGVRPGRAAWLRFLGDTYVNGDDGAVGEHPAASS